MRYRNAIGAVLGLLMTAMVVSSSAFAAGGTVAQKVVMFKESVSWREVEAFGREWEPVGVSVVMELPLINGLVLAIPSGVNLDEIASDPRVSGVEGDQKLNLGENASGQKKSFIEPVKQPYRKE